jgi:hypothetical protein
MRERGIGCHALTARPPNRLFHLVFESP